MSHTAPRLLAVEVHGAPTLLRLGLEQAVTRAGLSLARADVQADVHIVGTNRATPSTPAVILRLDADLLTVIITAREPSSLRPELIALLAAALGMANTCP